MENETPNERRKEELSKFPESIAPMYVTSSANSPIQLFEGSMGIRFPGGNLSGIGAIEFNWLPHPSIRFRLASDAMVAIVDEVQLNLPTINRTCDARITHMEIGKPPHLYYGHLRTPVVIGTISDCDCLIFHLPNFFELFGATIRDSDYTGSWCGRLLLESIDWKVVLDANMHSSEVLEQLEDVSGFALTHTGSLQRVDGSQFDIRSALDLMDALYFFFSFMRGFWSGPILPVAQATSMNKWILWNTLKLTPWQQVRAWVPLHDGQAIGQLGQAFNGFMKRWTSELWRDPIRYAIHWYVESNLKSGGLEGSIILIQTALELLGFLFLVEDPTTRELSATKFNDLHSEAKIRYLLDRMRIPTKIPQELAALLDVATKLGAVDSPDALVKIRNTIVHPKPKHRQSLAEISTQERYEAWELGLWYLELVLLHVFEHSSVYYKRFSSGYPDEIREILPWIP